MHNTSIERAVRSRLLAIAESLMWEGDDLAADAIYAHAEAIKGSARGNGSVVSLFSSRDSA